MLGASNSLPEHAAQLERDRCAAGADEEATEPAWIQRSGEERRTGADVGSYDMRLPETERIGDADDELAHSLG